MLSNPMPFNLLRLFKVNRWVPDGESKNLSELDSGVLEETSSLDEAHIVSSQFRENAKSHMIVVDIDVPAALVPSTTPGHSHLFIEAQMSWDTYERLLDALNMAGVVEPGYVAAAKTRGFTAVRLPWVRKPASRCRIEHVEI